MLRAVIVNADDYAMDEAVDAAVLTLADKGAVTSISAMVLSPGWPHAAKALRGTAADAGLHLDLTSPFAHPPTGASLPSLIGRSLLRQLNLRAIERTVAEQFARFEDEAGHPPAFVDGHQHVHALPGIREAVAGEIVRRYGEGATRTVWVRDCRPKHWRGAKAAVIGGLGSEGLARVCARARIRVNTDFAGVYGFEPEADLPKLWRSWLHTMTGDTPLIMCHPAKPGSRIEIADPIRPARLAEYEFLASAGFARTLSDFGFQASPWPRSPS
jgi:predicted glycoside hydrolase/deacetylase ChbG (UPF0249 family)